MAVNIAWLTLLTTPLLILLQSKCASDLNMLEKNSALSGSLLFVSSVQKHKKESDPFATGRSLLATLSGTNPGRGDETEEDIDGSKEKSNKTPDMSLIWIIVDYSAIYPCVGVA